MQMTQDMRYGLPSANGFEPYQAESMIHEELFGPQTMASPVCGQKLIRGTLRSCRLGTHGKACSPCSLYDACPSLKKQGGLGNVGHSALPSVRTSKPIRHRAARSRRIHRIDNITCRDKSAAREQDKGKGRYKRLPASLAVRPQVHS